MSRQSISQKKDAQTLSERQRRIFEFLDRFHIGVLSTVTPDGNPHGVVVYYVPDRDFTIHILTRTGTRKYDNLIHNNHAMLTIYDPEIQTVTQVTGVASERPSIHTINQVADAIYKKQAALHKGLPPIMKLQAGTFTTFQIEPVQIRMARYSSSGPASYEDMFMSVESFDFKAE